MGNNHNIARLRMRTHEFHHPGVDELQLSALEVALVYICISAGSHSIPLDCDGAAGSSSSPCLAICCFTIWRSPNVRSHTLGTRNYHQTSLLPPLDRSGLSAHILGSARPWDVPTLDTRTAPLPSWRNISCKCIPFVDRYLLT